MATGEATVDFGAFPGSSHATVAVTGQTGVVAGSILEAWVYPNTTADHSADEHMVESIKATIPKTSIVAGTGFTIHVFNTSEINEPIDSFKGGPSQVVTPDMRQLPSSGGIGTRIYGTWNVAWAGNYT